MEKPTNSTTPEIDVSHTKNAPVTDPVTVHQPPVPAITFKDIQRMLTRRGIIMLIVLIVCVVSGMFWTLSQPRYYEALTEIIVSRPTQTFADSANSIPLLQDLQGLTRTRSIRTQVRVLQSNALRLAALESLPESMRPIAQEATLEITDSRDTDIISINVTARDSDIAAQYANCIVDTYMKQEAQQYLEASKTALVYLESELSRVGDEMRTAYTQVEEFKRKTGLYAPEVMMSERVQAQSNLDSQIRATQVDLAQARQDKSSLANALQSEDRQIVAEMSEVRNPRRSELEQLIQQYESQRVELLKSYTVTAPEVLAIEKQIDATRLRFNQEMQTVIASKQITNNPHRLALREQYISKHVTIIGLNIRMAALQQQQKGMLKELNAMTSKERNATELLNTVAQLDATYQLLNQNYQTLRISQTARLPSVQIIMEAMPSSIPVSPNIIRSFIMFLLLGICCAIVFGLLLERSDDRVYSLEEVEQISGLPVLGQVPIATDATLAHMESASFGMLESFRMLRGNLLFSNLDRRVRILAVSSASSGEGKSTSAINLAIVMAMSGKHVILVDGDFHRPSLYKYLDLQMTVGITNVVTGISSLTEAIQPTSIQGLSLLTTGPLPPNPSELLNSQSMRRMVEELAEMFDAVIIDAPPTVGLSDVPIIATFVDGLLFVVSAKETHRHRLQSALRSLRYVNTQLLGCIFNKVPANGAHYGGYYYQYGYDQDNNRKKSRKKRYHLRDEPSTLDATRTKDNK